MAHNGAENLKGRVAASCCYRMVKHWFAESLAAKQIREVRIGRAFTDAIRAVCTGALHRAPSSTQQAGQLFVANDDCASFARSGAGMGADAEMRIMMLVLLVIMIVVLVAIVVAAVVVVTTTAMMMSMIMTASPAYIAIAYLLPWGPVIRTLNTRTSGGGRAAGDSKWSSFGKEWRRLQSETNDCNSCLKQEIFVETLLCAGDFEDGRMGGDIGGAAGTSLCDKRCSRTDSSQ